MKQVKVNEMLSLSPNQTVKMLTFSELCLSKSMTFIQGGCNGHLVMLPRSTSSSYKTTVHFRGWLRSDSALAEVIHLAQV